MSESTDLDDASQQPAMPDPKAAPVVADTATDLAPVSAPAVGPAPKRKFDDVFAPRQMRKFDDVFAPQPDATAMQRVMPWTAPDFAHTPDSLDPEQWSAFLEAGPTGRIIKAVGAPMFEKGFGDDAIAFMKEHGLYNDYEAQDREGQMTWQQALMRPTVNMARSFLEGLTYPVIAAADVGMKAAEGLLAAPAQIGEELGHTALGRTIGAEQLGRDISAIGETAMTWGGTGAGHMPGEPAVETRPPVRNPAADEMFEWAENRQKAIDAKANGTPARTIVDAETGQTHEVPEVPGQILSTQEIQERDLLSRHADNPDVLTAMYPGLEDYLRDRKLPPVAAEAVVHDVVGPNGEEGYFGTAPETEAEASSRAAAAGDRPIATPAVEATPEPTLHDIASLIDPETMREYDRLDQERQTYVRWMRDLPEQTEANIEAKPPEALRNIDDRVSQIEAKFESGVNREGKTGQRYTAELADLQERRDALMSDLVRNHPDMVKVRESLQKADYAMRDLSAQRSAVLAEAARRMPPERTPEAVADEKVSETAPQAPETAPPAAEAAPGAPEAAAGPPAAPAAPEFAPKGPASSPEQLKAIADHVSARLVALGRPAEEAQAMGQLVAEHYGARAQRWGGARGNAQEMYEREAPDIQNAKAPPARAARPRKGSSRVRELAQRAREFFQSAYHGSPHIFDKFTLDHIGKGEGAQAFGHGLYFAGNKAVAKFYREKLSGGTHGVTTKSGTTILRNGNPVQIADGYYDAVKTLLHWAEKEGVKNSDELLAALEKRHAGETWWRRTTGDGAIIDEVRRGLLKNGPFEIGKNQAGRLYHVELAPDEHEWLDWDKALKDQSPHVQKALADAGMVDLTKDANKSGEEIYRDAGVRAIDQSEPPGNGWTSFRQTVNDRVTNQRVASESLNKAGVPGIRYFDAMSRDRGEGTHNFVVFDPGDITIKEFEQGEGVPKGAYTISARGGRALIKLFETADASTLIHETGHHFLEELMADAERTDAPESVKQDAATVRKWLGSKESGPITTARHEKWARGFERYLMEGVAPSRALETVFQKFKDWLTKIYETVTRLKSPINDDIRDVFDRLLAHTPERATIAPELPLSETLGDAHGRLASSIPPMGDAEEAAAGRIAAETSARIRREDQAHAKEIVDELRLRRGIAPGEAGGGTPQHPGGDRGGDAAGHLDASGRPVSGSGEVVPGGGAPASTRIGPPKTEGIAKDAPAALRQRVPKRPPSLADWVKARGGIAPKDFAEVIGAEKRSKPGLVKETGESADRLAEVAGEEGGFFPELQGRRPTVREFLDKLGQDIRHGDQWREDQADEVADYQAKLAHNTEIDRIASELDIEPHGLSYAGFWDKVADRMSADQQAKELESLGSARAEDMAEADRQAEEFLADRGEAWQPDAVESGNAPRTLEDLENERRSEESARGPLTGAPDVAEPGSAGAGAGPVQERGGQGGRGAGADGRAGPEGEQGPPERTRRLDDGTADGLAKNIGKVGFNPDAAFSDAKPARDLAGNIRLENLNTSDDVDDLLRAWAKGRDDLFDARHNQESYEGQLRVEAARALLVDVATSTRQAEIAFAESGLEADAVKLLQWRDRLNMVGDRVATLTASAGRTLAAFRKMPEAKEIMARLQNRTLFQLMRQEASLNATLETPAQLARAAKRQAMTPWERRYDIGRGMLIEYYVNDLISGPITHAAYVVGNAFTAFAKGAFEIPLAAGIGRAAELLTGEKIPDRVRLNEAKAMWLSLGKGFRDGFPAAWKATKAGVPELLEGESSAQASMFSAAGRAGHEIPGVIGDVINAPSHVITGIHTLSRTVNYQIEKAALIAHQASAEGLKGAAYDRRVAELDANPSQDIMDRARQEADHMVMMDRGKWDSLTSRVSALSNAYLPIKLVLPFVRIGANLLHGALVERTVVGLFEKNIRDNLAGVNGERARYVQAGKIATGTAIAVGVYAMAAEGLVTGAEPTNPAEAALWRLSGKQAYSIRVGDHWVPYRKWLGWYGPLVAMAANVHQVGATMSEKGLGAAATAAVFGFSEVVNDESWFRGMADFTDAVKHWDTDGERYVKNLGTSFIPFSVGLSQVARLVDPYRRHAEGFMQEALNKMPGLSETLLPQRDIFGEKLASHTQVTATRVNDDPVIKAMQTVNIWPRQVDKKIRGVPLTAEQHDTFAATAGGLLKHEMDRLVQDPGFMTQPGSVRRDLIKRVISGSRDKARQLIIMQSVGGPNDIMKQSIDAKATEKADYDER